MTTPTGVAKLHSVARLVCWTLAFGLLMWGMPTTAQQQLVTVRVGLSPTDDDTPVVWAVRNGLYSKAGLDLQIQKASSGAAVTAAVVSGSLEIGESSLVPLMNAHLRGVPVVLVAGGSVYQTKAPIAVFAVAADSPIKSAKGLEGRTIGVSSLNDFMQVVTEAWVAKNGGDPAKLKFIEVPNAAVAPSIIEHRIDGAVLFNVSLATALASGKVRVLGAAPSVIGDYFILAGWFASKDWAAKNPDVVSTFARVTERAAAYTNAHHAETAPMIADFTGVPLPLLQQMTRTDTTTVLDPEEIQPLIDFAAKFKIIPHSFPAQELIYSPNGR